MLKDVDVKVQQERINNGAISSWYLYEVLSPKGSSAEYDYVMIISNNSFKTALETTYTFDSALKKTFQGKDAKFFSDYYSMQTATWRLVKEEIYAGLAVADSSFPSGSQLKYIATDYMQPKPGKEEDYVKSELDTFRLIHKERIKLGALTQWAFLQLVAPYDPKIEYSYLTINFSKDIDMMLGNAKYVEATKTAFPIVSLSDIFKTALPLRDNPRAEFLRLVLYILPIKR